MAHINLATDSATTLRPLTGDDATATFENDPRFAGSDPAAFASSENLNVAGVEEDEDDFDDEEEDEDDEDEDEDDDEEDEEEDEDEDEEDDAVGEHDEEDEGVVAEKQAL
jgi:hypothetical protein